MAAIGSVVILAVLVRLIQGGAHRRRRRSSARELYTRRLRDGGRDRA